jgi:serine/threonine protein kinase
MSFSADPLEEASASSPLEKIDLIADRFEAAWKRGEAPSIQAFLGEATGAFRVDLLGELVAIDRVYRRRAGRDASLEDYLHEYPELAGGAPAEPAATNPWQTQLTPDENTDGAGDTLPEPGSHLASYELIEKLGGGGMGVVFRARHVLLKKEFALKVLSPGLARDPEAMARFRREMQAVGRLEHVHLVRASDAAVIDGIPFLVMELLDGSDLARLTERIGPWPMAEACAAVRQAVLGLQRIHECGMVHRDIKPSNLLLTHGGVVKVLDLGLAQLAEEAETGPMTEAGRMMGTPDYVGPEQILDSHAVDIRSDLYSLGCTLFHLLTGEPPFGKTTHPTLGRKREAHLTETAPDLRKRRPEVPEELAAVVARLLAKRPDERYATPAEVAAVLEPFTTAARLPRLLEDNLTPTRSMDQGATKVVSATRKMSWRLWLSLGIPLATACLVVPLAWWWFGQREPVSRTIPPEPLTIRALHVFRYRAEGENDRLLGELGKDTYQTRLNDKVEIEAELSEPAYAYLLAFNPTDDVNKQVQLCLSDGENALPELRPKVSYQAAGKRFQLDDGVGLQAIVLLASRQPLPAYAEWRRQTSALPWKRVRATAGIVWQGDGRRLDRLKAPGDLRGKEVASEEAAILEELNRQLAADARIETVTLIAFAVDR